MPIFRRDGTFFGTLCAIDPKPAKLKNPQIVGMFKLFAELISFNVDAQERLASSEAALFSERQSSELREQFIAVLGHDLRNPLASISAGATLLAKQKLEGNARTILPLMQKSVRAHGEPDRQRARSGARPSRRRADKSTATADEPLAPALVQVVDELRSAWPDRPIEVEMNLDAPVDCDPPRIAQLLSNLLANALVHGTGTGAGARCLATMESSSSPWRMAATLFRRR